MRKQAEYLQKLADVPKSRLALINATRWHSSVYVAYQFLLERLYDVIEWLHQEKTLPPSGMELKESLDAQDKINEVKRQLEAYVDVYGPMAEHMTCISDGSRAFPVAVEIYARERKLEHHYSRALDAMKDQDGWRTILLERIVAGLEYKPDRGDHTEMWKAIRELDPRRVKQGLKTMPHDAFQTATKFNFPEEEWNKFIELAGKPGTDVEDVAGFWESAIVTSSLPELAPISLYLIWLPVVVTQCDGVMSVEACVLRANMGNINQKHAASKVQWKCNGDITNLYGGRFKRFWGDAKPV